MTQSSTPTFIELSSVSISYLVHSTEEAGRLQASICSSLGLDHGDIATEELEGHFGNKLQKVTSHITGDRAFEIARKVLFNLDANSKKQLSEEIDRHLDEHDALFLRIDRQELPGNLILGEEEAIRIKIKPRFRKNRRSMIEAYMELLK